MNPQQTSQVTQGTYDLSIARNLAGAIILSLLLVFVIQRAGFRFVVAVGSGG